MTQMLSPSIPATEVADQLECAPENLEYWAWPQVFASTSGPFRRLGGISGSAMTRFTIEALHDGGGVAVLFCNGQVLKLTRAFVPQMLV
jgi:hypothetical protein